MSISNPEQDHGVVFFAVPKAFVGHEAVIQTNAISSWQQLESTQAVALCGNDEGIAEAAASLDCHHIPDIATSASGIPLLDDVFARAQERFDAPVYCFVNCDIILLREFDPVARTVSANLPRFLASARRIDLDVVGPIDFSDGWDAVLRRRATEEGTFSPLWNAGADIHLFSKGLFDSMPPFVAGRFFWEAWMLRHSLDVGAALVDLSPSLPVLHQNHAYQHIFGKPNARGMGVFPSELDVRRNRALAGRRVAPLVRATHSLREGRLVDHRTDAIGTRYRLLAVYAEVRRVTQRVLWINRYVFRLYIRLTLLRERLHQRLLIFAAVRSRIRRALARRFKSLPT